MCPPGFRVLGPSWAPRSVGITWRRRHTRTMTSLAATPALTQLDRAQYISLRTTKRDGSAVDTPVWFAVDGDRLLVFTGADSGKAKRIRNDPQVTVAVCDARGSVKSPPFAGRAELLDADDLVRVEQVLGRKYGLQKTAFQLAQTALRLVRRQPESPSVGIAITLDPRP